VKRQKIVKDESSSSSPQKSKRSITRVRNNNVSSRVETQSKNDDNQNFGSWSPEEDSILLRFIHEHGGSKWTKLSEELRGRRNPQQCKRRWNALTRLILQRKKIN